MRIKSCLNLILCFQTICESHGISWTASQTTTKHELLNDESLVHSSRPKNGSKIKFKSRHSHHRLDMTFKPIVQTNLFQKRVTNRGVKSISTIDMRYLKEKTTKYESPAIKGRKIFGKRRNKETNDIDQPNHPFNNPFNNPSNNPPNNPPSNPSNHSSNPINPFQEEINSLKIAEKCLMDLIPHLERLDLRTRILYKCSRRRRLHFFDILLLKTQRFVDRLINKAHEESGLLFGTADKLNAIPKTKGKSAKALKWKSRVSSKYINELLLNAEKLKKKIDHTVKELNETLDEFVDEFKIKEDNIDYHLIHSDGTLELN